MVTQNKKAVLAWLDKYLRYVDYIGAAQLYLKDNVFLKTPLKKEDIKERVLGHWGTVPGLTFMYAHCNYLISKHGCDMMFMVGPGHGAPAVQATLFAEGTITEFYPQYPRNEAGTQAFVKSFSWPGGFPSHLTPMSPGSILEGGELGYSLATAYGAILDNPNLIVTCAVGDGEAESGPLATAWHSNKYVNPAESGAVLPILHVNGYKISGPTIFGAMGDQEITDLFSGYGYEPRIVEGENLHEQMIEAMEWAYQTIRKVQKDAREKGKVLCPRWPMIVLRTPKGATGVKEIHGKKVEGNFRSHGIPLGHVLEDKEEFTALKNWLESYKIQELVDASGKPKKEVLAFVPMGSKRMGNNKHAYGGTIRKPLVMPKVDDYAVEPHKSGEETDSNTEVGAKFIRDIFVKNKKQKNFRFMCPDETDSNKMGPLFEVTARPFMWPLHSYDERMSTDGRVMEMLSEHTLQGWLQGFLLTGRHGMFATYEAFAGIVATMVDQYAKFLKQAMKLKWRKPLSSLNYILTSLGWRQEHNGYSHQNPGFISGVLEKHGGFCSVYLPPDANSYLVALEDSLNRTNAVNVFVVGKQKMPQWLSLKEAREQLKTGVGIWKWATKGWKNPDVVMACAGDHMTVETMKAVELLKEMAPEVAVRVVNVSELTALGIGDEKHPLGLKPQEFDDIFTKDKPIVFNFHGYVDVIKKLVWNHHPASRVSIHGYSEEGTTTTPFDMHVRNRTSRYHLLMDAVQQVSAMNKKFVQPARKIVDWCEKQLTKHQQFIMKFGKDMPEVE